MVFHKTSFRVVFDHNPRGIYFDGQTLSGVVRIHQRRPKQVNRILLLVIGRGRICDTINATHRDYNFLRHEIVLADFMIGALLRAGDYNYNFSYKLKEKLCPSFYGRKGFVHYEIVITLLDNDRDIKRPIVQYKHPFTVLRSMSMSKYKRYYNMKPLEQTKSIDVCYYCCTISKPFDIMVQFPCRAFCPGDWLFIRLVCRSELREQLNLIKMKLLQNIKYTHMNGIETVTEQVRIAKVKTNYSANLKGKEFVVGLKIPLVHPTNENSYPDLVTITYRLEVEVDLLTCCDDRARFDFKVPIQVQNLEHFNYDYCTHKKKKEVITKQPQRSSHRNDASVSQTRVYPSAGWNPPNEVPSLLSPVVKVPPEIGYSNVFRADTTFYKPTYLPIPNSTDSGYPYSPRTVPSVVFKDIPCPPYPTYQSTIVPPSPIKSFSSNTIIDPLKVDALATVTFPPIPLQNGRTIAPLSKPVQMDPKPTEAPPSLEDLPVRPSTLVKSDGVAPSNTKPALVLSTEPTDPGVTICSYSPVYDQHAFSFASINPEERPNSPSSTKRLSPIPLSNTSITKQSSTTTSAPLFEHRTISNTITTTFEPVKPAIEVLDIMSPLPSVDCTVESLDKTKSSQFDDYSVSEYRKEPSTQNQGLKKGRQKMLGERKKKF